MDRPANEEDVVLKREVMVSAAPYVRVVPVSKERAVEIRGGTASTSPASRRRRTASARSTCRS